MMSRLRNRDQSSTEEFSHTSSEVSRYGTPVRSDEAVTIALQRGILHMDS